MNLKVLNIQRIYGERMKPTGYQKFQMELLANVFKKIGFDIRETTNGYSVPLREKDICCNIGLIQAVEYNGLVYTMVSISIDGGNKSCHNEYRSARLLAVYAALQLIPGMETSISEPIGSFGPIIPAAHSKTEAHEARILRHFNRKAFQAYLDLRKVG